MTPQGKARLLMERAESVMKVSPKGYSKAQILAFFLIDEVQKVAQRGQASPDYWSKVRQEIENF